MKKFNLVFAICIVAVTFLISSCEKVEPEMRSYSFSILRNNSPLSNSRVSITTENQDYAVETDNDGNCQINIPNNVALPEFVIATIDHSSIRPYALSVSGAINAKSSMPMNCQNVPSRVLLKHVPLHHLGNDRYDGSANSQLQLPAEGTQRAFNFNLTSIPNTMPRLQIYVRGVQHSMKIYINGRLVSGSQNSPSNGDIIRFDGQLDNSVTPRNILNIGTNTLTIKTGETGYSTDPWDDIEFCGLLLYY